MIVAEKMRQKKKHVAKLQSLYFSPVINRVIASGSARFQGTLDIDAADDYYY